MAYYFVNEFYTLDIGAQLPLVRFRFFADPDGVDDGEPFFPRWALPNFEITGGRDGTDLAKLLAQPPTLGPGWGGYAPLDILLARVENNFEFYTEVRFPLQYLRVLRPLLSKIICHHPEFPAVPWGNRA